MLSARSLGIPEVSAFVKTLHLNEDEVARGGVADVYPALFQQTDAPALKVAIKTVRTESYQTAPESLLVKTRRKLNRELGVWRTLQRELEHPNLLRLLGVIDSPNGLPSSVSEFCTTTLAEYLVNPDYKPQRIQLLVGTLRGLAYIHGFSIIHGDLKGLNILVTESGTPKICDFGHSRFAEDSAQPAVSDLSSKFHATTRYMSPELFTDPKNKPTLFSDIWAYGCVALEILSQLRPYHIIKNEHRVTLAIKAGRAPSVKPEYPYAASCLTDMLWSIIKQCWHPHQSSRPTATSLLNAIDGLIEKGQLNPATSTPLRSATDLGEELLDWPEGIEDFKDALSGFAKTKISMQRMADVFLYKDSSEVASESGKSKDASQAFTVKVLRAPGGLGSTNRAIDPLQQGLVRLVRERISIQHQNIIELLGLDGSFGRYPGLVMEYCSGGNLRDYLNSFPIIDNDDHFQIRCMMQILAGLQFLHSLPSPLAHGDLTPYNILADRNGVLKLTLICFARLSANLPSNTQTAAPADDAISARYLSPELLAKDDGSWTTPRSDMWSFGCVACWMYVQLDPYPECKLEHQVILSITEGLPPYSTSQLSKMGPLGGLHIMPNAPWITNGVLAAIIRCWNQDGQHRPAASVCLKDFAALLHKSDSRGTPISADVRDLTGKVITPDHPRKKILGHCRGLWRRVFNYKDDEPIELLYWWWRGAYSPGLFRRSVEVNVKGVRLSVGVRGGDILESAQQCIHHEIAILRLLKHDNICAFLGYDKAHGGTIARPQAPAIITGFCANGTLTEYCLKQSGNLSFQNRLNLTRDVASALFYIHDQVPTGSVVHGNLSTDTILVDRKGIAKLSGFEFACQYEHSDNPKLARVIFAPHVALNPSRWHAPELFTDATDTTPPFPTRYADLWALGCVLVAVLNDQPPYERYDLPGAINCIAEGLKPYSRDICAADIWGLADSLWATIPHERTAAVQAASRISSF